MPGKSTRRCWRLGRASNMKSMRFQTGIIIFVLAMLVTPPAALAKWVRQLSYSYEYGVVDDVGSEREFVICDVCPPGEGVSAVMKMPVLALRMSGGPSDGGATMAEAGLGESGKQGSGGPVKDSVLPPAYGPSGPCPQVPGEKGVIETIWFELDRAEILPGEMSKINDVAVYLGATPAPVTVRGYTCDLGGNEYNDALALKRARAVAERLRILGVNVSDVLGEGECCYLSEDIREVNRRVEISISK